MPNNIHYETMMGSVAYGVSSDTSDIDLYGFCIPPKEIIFPHLAGEILGFGRQIKRFEQYQQHHIKDEFRGKEYDITIYNIVKFFQLCMDNNPNMVDCLFTPHTCVLHTTHIGSMVRENRKIFLHKGCYHKFKGYAYSQLQKMQNKNARKGKRKEIIEKYDYDVKFAYHLCRLLDECEQILVHHDLDLMNSREFLKAIRKGLVPEKDVIEFFSIKEKTLEKLYNESTLPYGPDEGRIKQLLLNCLEEHYGSIDNCVVNPNKADIALREISEIIERYNV